ncbi:MAG: hypothetical protein ACUVXA_16185 [Candidatus Jordarchaeum sp.]|uniref:hypothetical protein n=1 Tax=Candidatus Jordarchaeum sp. TaxID=2823881 RepID=UPI00404A3060
MRRGGPTSEKHLKTISHKPAIPNIRHPPTSSPQKQAPNEPTILSKNKHPKSGGDKNLKTHQKHQPTPQQITQQQHHKQTANPAATPCLNKTGKTMKTT